MRRIKSALHLLLLFTGVLVCSNKAQASVGKLDYDTIKLKTKICTMKSKEYTPTWDEDGYMGCWHGSWEENTELIQFVDAKGNYTIAYADEKHVYIDVISTTGEIKHKLSLVRQYPLLKDVICDQNNNYYIVWGQADKRESETCVTIAITKYNEQGEYLDACDVLSSPSISDTRVPANSCDTVIANGVLTTVMGRYMYDNHQSNTSVSVDIETMELLKTDVCYVSHCFASRVMELSSGELLYGNQGDGYPRGFKFQYGDKDNAKTVTPFHFYGELGDNDTYAQFGDMVELGDKIFYCATSPKTMTEDFEGESQNLFIQGINFEFEGGSSRTGTSLGEKRTDTGIIWLTNYTNKHAKNPQIVKINDSQAVVMWETYDGEDDEMETHLDTYYMIISADGKIVQSAKSLNKVRLNTFEQPLLWNDAIYWISCGYSDSFRFISSKNATVYRLSLEHDNTIVKKGSRILTGNLIYKVTGKKTVSLIGTCDKLIEYEMAIPASIKYKGKTYKVTEIGKGAFKECPNLIRVTVGKNVKKIGDNAFAKCKNLNGVNIGKNVTTIGKKAFYNCKDIWDISFHTKKLKSVGKKAFSGFSKYTRVYVPASKINSYRKKLQKAGLKKSIRIRQNV